MSVKGEGGGGGVGDEGERVHVRGRLMRMQREEFSTRHSPPRLPLRPTLCSLWLRRCHSSAPAPRWPAGFGLLHPSNRSRPLSTGGGGVWASLPWMPGPGCCLKKRECAEGRAAGDKRGWGGSGREKMVMPAPRVLDVLLLYRLRGAQTQPRLSST